MNEAAAERKFGLREDIRARSLKGLGVLALTLIASCGPEPAATQPPKIEPSAVRLGGEDDALRVKIDAARDRTWVLGVTHVDVYDRRTQSLIRHISLPQWMVAYFVCGPDIAFDRTGAAYIAHNFEPKLWQIDPDTFELKAHTIRLVGKEHLDVGFGRLAFAPDGALYAVASSGGSRWRIDIASASARSVGADAPVRDDCPLE
jgi:hypothetical protein